MDSKQMSFLDQYEKNIVKSFEQKGITLEFNQDYNRLKKVLIAASDYDYEYDTFFEPEELKNVVDNPDFDFTELILVRK